MATERRFVPCKISPGFFKSEYYVSLVSNGSTVFVDKSKVKLQTPPSEDSEVDGFVLAYLIEEAEGREEALIELPGEPVVGGLRTWIPKMLLSSV